VTAAETALTVAERVGAAIYPEGADGLYPSASAEVVARLEAIFATGKPPRAVGQNPDSVENLTKRYNALVPTALALSIRAKHHSSLFGTVAGGKDVLKKLEAAIAAAQTEEHDTRRQG
jgi:hypothetical protein